jgi:L-ribulose-5-phosphate 3-epimerase
MPPRVTIMQGRLVGPEDGRFQSFPRQQWRREFEHARQAGLDGIEWIYDTYGVDANPIATDAGGLEMLALSAAAGVSLKSVCADYFMEHPLVGDAGDVEDRLARLRWLLQRCSRLGIERVILPFVDQSQIKSEAESARVVTVLSDILPAVEATGVEIHLETSLPPHDFGRLLAALPHPLIKVTYDTGNSASLGYKASDEFAAYGDRIGSVHIKDRVLNGGSVPLGTGSADFPAIFAALVALDYSGEFVLQVARSAEVSEVEWAKHNRAFLSSALQSVAQTSNSKRT